FGKEERSGGCSGAGLKLARRVHTERNVWVLSSLRELAGTGGRGRRGGWGNFCHCIEGKREGAVRDGTGHGAAARRGWAGQTAWLARPRGAGRLAAAKRPAPGRR
ncbi:unnamed protein product, partial [Phaeothamnion confervicola]